MIESGIELSAELLKLARTPHRAAKVRYLLRQLRWLERNHLPVEFLARLCSDLEVAPVSVDADVDHPFELPYGERLVLATIAALRRPRTILEFGTFSGTTTKLLADAVPESTVHTLDLPAEDFPFDDWISGIVGVAFRDDSRYEGRIVQHRTSSRDFDFGPLAGKVDLVYIDASHEYQDVLHDSRRALEIVSPDGWIVWDDYQPDIPGVVDAVLQLHREGVPVAQVAETRLVVHRADGFPHPLAGREGRSWRRSPMRAPEEVTRRYRS